MSQTAAIATQPENALEPTYEDRRKSLRYRSIAELAMEVIAPALDGAGIGLARNLPQRKKFEVQLIVVAHSGRA